MSASLKTRCPHALVVWHPLPNPSGKPWNQRYERQAHPCGINHRRTETLIDRQLFHRAGRYRWLT